MCGIVACVGENVGNLAVTGLQRMQYRGYDSYGFAWVNGEDGQILTRRSIDPLDDLEDHLPICSSVLGHTRWATHGGVSVENCHPHTATSGEFSLVHNGIVENYQDLKQKTGADTYASETDTEVIVKLLEIALEQTNSRCQALWKVLDQLGGRNTIVVLFADGELLGVRQGSPLVLGKSDKGYFLGSDVLSFSCHSTLCYSVGDREMVHIQGQDLSVYDKHGGLLEIGWQLVESGESIISKDGHPHFMLKEIMEQWQTVTQGMAMDVTRQEFVENLRGCENILLTGAGGAYFACVQIAWLLREIAGIRALAIPAYEIESMSPMFKEGDFVLAVSQSGETADTIQAVEVASSWGLRIASLVNMPMSTLARLSEFSMANHCGPEICVLSTKSATAQVAFGYLLATSLSRLPDLKKNMNHLSSTLSRYLSGETSRKIKSLALSLRSEQHLFILGRGHFYGTALVAALNIKEASYVHAEAFAAGELKHGVIALIEEGVPVILFSDSLDPYMLNVAAQVKSRGARVICIGYEDNELFDHFIPLPVLPDPLLATVSAMIPCQLLAYHLAVQAGLNPDKPRNLAKSVTVQ
jgi:glucosamine--fructose-6-phosphate aminotransferase (isomerizing)